MIVDQIARTITDRAVPYGVVAARNGLRYQFTRGSITWGYPHRVKLRAEHDPTQVIGRAIDLDDLDDGIHARLVVARGRAGDRALAYAADGRWPGLSIGLADDATWDLRGDIHHCVCGVLAEISLTPNPAFLQRAA